MTITTKTIKVAECDLCGDSYDPYRGPVGTQRPAKLMASGTTTTGLGSRIQTLARASSVEAQRWFVDTSES